MHSLRLLGIATLLLSCFLNSAWAQFVPGQNPIPGADNAAGQTQQDAEMERQLAIARQKKRFDDVKRESQKLLELATELKQYVDRSGEGVLSLEVVRKAEEMEKLARQVKNNMRGQ
jgi:hypothetical protein